MIMPTLDIINFLTEKNPLNAFIIGPAGAGKTFLIRELIPNLVGKECIELYVDRDYNYFEYNIPIKKYNAETIDVEKEYPFKSDVFTKLVKVIFTGDNSNRRLVIVDDVNRLIEDVEGFIRDLQRKRYNYILLFLDASDNLPNLIQHVDYLIISLWMRFKLAKINKILNIELDQDIYSNLLPKSFTWLTVKV